MCPPEERAKEEPLHTDSTCFEVGVSEGTRQCENEGTEQGRRTESERASEVGWIWGVGRMVGWVGWRDQSWSVGTITLLSTCSAYG